MIGGRGGAEGTERIDMLDLRYDTNISGISWRRVKYEVIMRYPTQEASQSTQ